MSLPTETKSIENGGNYDFTVLCSYSPIFKDAFVRSENAWFSLAEKVYYAELCLKDLTNMNYSEIMVPGKGLYDLSTHGDILDDCRTHIEDIKSYNLKDIDVDDISLDNLSGLINSNIPYEFKIDFCNLLEYDALMKDAVNLKYKESLLTKNSTSNSKDTSQITSFTDTLKMIPDVISDAFSNPKETFTKVASITAVGSLLMSGFAAAFDSNHDVTQDSANTMYHDMLHKIDSILPNLPDIMPVAAAQSVTQSAPPQPPTQFTGYGKLDGSIVNSSEVSMTALVNGTTYEITTWFTDGSGDDYCSITIPYDDSNAGKNVTFFCLDDDTAQEFKSEENGTMISGASNYPFNLTFTDNKSPIIHNKNLSIFVNDSDDRLDDTNLSITTNENVSILVKEGESELLNSTDLKKYWNFILNNQTEGHHIYNITVSDTNNNQNMTQLSTTIDTTLPDMIDYLISVFDRDGDGNNDDVKLTLNLTENASTYASIMGLVTNATNSTFLTDPILYFNNLTEGNYTGLDVNSTDLAGNKNNFSLIFPINITKKVVKEEPDNPIVNPPSGGGGGGGGGTGGEDYENIIYKDVLGEKIINGETTTYNFNDPENPINSLEFISQTNKGSQNLNVQVLEELSALVDKEPEDIVAMYFNMYLGLAGTDNGLDDIKLEFGLSDDTIFDKSLDLYSIRLMCSEDGEWEEHETEYLYHDKVNGEYVFSVKLDHISGNYAIVGKDATMIPMLTNIGGDKPDISQSEPDNTDVPETSPPSTENNEDNQAQGDGKEPESTPNLAPWASILTAAYLSTLRKKKKNI